MTTDELCRYCGAPQTVENNRTDLTPASRHWTECSDVNCRARGPVRSSGAEAVRAAKMLPAGMSLIGVNSDGQSVSANSTPCAPYTL